MEGCVFNVQKYSVHDGPGIRTIVFFKGCPLRCKWCCNPESQLTYPQIAYNAEKCIGHSCTLCANVCPAKSITVLWGFMMISCRLSSICQKIARP